MLRSAVSVDVCAVRVAVLAHRCGEPSIDGFLVVVPTPDVEPETFETKSAHRLPRAQQGLHQIREVEVSVRRDVREDLQLYHVDAQAHRGSPLRLLYVLVDPISGRADVQ